MWTRTVLCTREVPSASRTKLNTEFAQFMKWGQLAWRHLISSDATWGSRPAPLHSPRVAHSILQALAETICKFLVRRNRGVVYRDRGVPRRLPCEEVGVLV